MSLLTKIVTDPKWAESEIVRLRVITRAAQVLCNWAEHKQVTIPADIEPSFFFLQTILRDEPPLSQPVGDVLQVVFDEDRFPHTKPLR